MIDGQLLIPNVFKKISSPFLASTYLFSSSFVNGIPVLIFFLILIINHFCIKVYFENISFYFIFVQVVDNKISAPKEVLAIEYKKTPEVEETRSPSPPPPEPVKEVEAPVAEPPDLLVIFRSVFVPCRWHLLSLRSVFVTLLISVPFLLLGFE